MSALPQTSKNVQRADLYRRMDKHHLAPLWEVLHALVPPEPQTPCVPGFWKYRDARPYVDQGGARRTLEDRR